MFNIHRPFEQQWQQLMQAIAACRVEPDKDAVHAVRTSSRRMEALLRKALEDHRGTEAFGNEAAKALRQLKKLRKLAGPVRDLDVQRKLAEEVHTELLSTGEKPALSSATREFKRLDRHLRRERRQAAAKLRKLLGKRELSLARALQRTAGEIEALKTATLPPLATAKGWARRSSRHIGQLDTGNLHDFRKQTKAARYVAELPPASKEARGFARQLHGVQDSIGLWHDWELLTGEAKDFLGGDSTMSAAFEKKRGLALSAALKRTAGANLL